MACSEVEDAFFGGCHEWNRRRFIVEGTVGVGKTEIIKQLVESYENAQPYVSDFIEGTVVRDKEMVNGAGVLFVPEPAKLWKAECEEFYKRLGTSSHAEAFHTLQKKIISVMVDREVEMRRFLQKNPKHVVVQERSFSFMPLFFKLNAGNATFGTALTLLPFVNEMRKWEDGSTCYIMMTGDGTEDLYAKRVEERGDSIPRTYLRRLGRLYSKVGRYVGQQATLKCHCRWPDEGHGDMKHELLEKIDKIVYEQGPDEMEED